jgi:plastocyanin
LATLLVLMLAAFSMAAAEEMETRYWSGNNTTTIAPFYAEGSWNITLGAWCFEGIGFVRVTVYNEDGDEVDQVQIIGEGTTDAVFETPPGNYHMEVTVSHWHTYTWEILIEPANAAITVAVVESETAVAENIEASGSVVEIRMATDGVDVYFDPIGVWVEPGTTVRFVLDGGAHDTQSYHPSNATDLLRIPAGAEPWNSGIMGGIYNTATTFDVTLTAEGVYDYFCMPHELHGMVGRIVVGDPNESPARPVDELAHQAARDALPSVEEIMSNREVHR